MRYVFFSGDYYSLIQAQYSKAIQTDDDRNSVREFSMGSQEFDFDDDMMGMDGPFRGRTHSHDLESPMTTDDLASLLPGYFSKAKHEEVRESFIFLPLIMLFSLVS